MREYGTLLLVASLPSQHGIGAFSKEAYDFIGILKVAGQSSWQILPLGPTGFEDSPCQSFLVFAGNPYFIDLERLMEEGLLTREECLDAGFGNGERNTGYKKIYGGRFLFLRKAYKRWRAGRSPELVHELVGRELGDKIGEYCFYIAVKNHFDPCSWDLWGEGIRPRKPGVPEVYRAMLMDRVGFYEFQQTESEEQWDAFRRYAHEQGIRIIRNIPTCVASDSVDSQSWSGLFQFDENNMSRVMMGCPPDGFSATGQLWGNPLHNWEYHRRTGFVWWMRRMGYCFRTYDLMWVDHLRGFNKHYVTPYDDVTAKYGHWEKGPDIEVFRQIQEYLGGDKLPTIAEDLGSLIPTVRQLLKDTGLPGTKVLEFAFDAGENSDYLPYKYGSNCVVYTGTYNDDTTEGWFASLNEYDRNSVREYIGAGCTLEGEIHRDLIRAALGSVADLAVIPIQDYLGYDTSARISKSSILGKNWRWRMSRGDLNEDTTEWCRRLARTYGRLGETQEKGKSTSII